MIWAVNFNFINHVIINQRTKKKKKPLCLERIYRRVQREFCNILSRFCLFLQFSHSVMSDSLRPHDNMWSPGEGNGKQLQYSCLESPTNSLFLSSLLLLSFFFLVYHRAYEILVAQSRIKPMSPAVEVCTFNFWTTREIPRC